MATGRNVKSQYSSCLVIPSLTQTSPAWVVQSCYGKTLETSKLVQEFSTTCLVCLILKSPWIISAPVGIGVPVRFLSDRWFSDIVGCRKAYWVIFHNPCLTNIVLFRACSTSTEKIHETFWYVFVGVSSKICETSLDNPAFFSMICIIVSCTHVSYL